MIYENPLFLSQPAVDPVKIRPKLWPYLPGCHSGFNAEEFVSFPPNDNNQEDLPTPFLFL